MLDIAHLCAFGRNADFGSVSGAARLLGQPKVSVRRSLDGRNSPFAPLLSSARRIRLSVAARLLQHHAAPILDDVDEAENAIGGLIGPARPCA